MTPTRPRKGCATVLACVAIVLLLAFIAVVWTRYGAGGGAARRAPDTPRPSGESLSHTKRVYVADLSKQTVWTALRTGDSLCFF